jgi:hypothetical protein
MLVKKNNTSHDDFYLGGHLKFDNKYYAAYWKYGKGITSLSNEQSRVISAYLLPDPDDNTKKVPYFGGYIELDNG